jgi:hypothetical protein
MTWRARFAAVANQPFRGSLDGLADILEHAPGNTDDRIQSAAARPCARCHCRAVMAGPGNAGSAVSVTGPLSQGMTQARAVMA